MDHDDPQTLMRMIFYLYTFDYPEEGIPEFGAKCAAMEHSSSLQLLRKTSTTPDEEPPLTTSWQATDTKDSRIVNNAHVYAVAEKYDIPELKELAKGKFQALVSSKWPLDDFYDIAEAVFSTTPDEDMGLRQIMLDICATHFLDILKHKDSSAGFLEIQPIAAVVLSAVARKIDQDEVVLNEALANQMAIKEELSKAKAKTIFQGDKWMSELETAFGKANKLVCTSCYTQRLGWWLDRSGGEFGERKPSVQLKCLQCNRTLSNYALQVL